MTTIVRKDRCTIKMYNSSLMENNKILAVLQIAI